MIGDYLASRTPEELDIQLAAWKAQLTDNPPSVFELGMTSGFFLSSMVASLEAEREKRTVTGEKLRELTEADLKTMIEKLGSEWYSSAPDYATQRRIRMEEVLVERELERRDRLRNQVIPMLRPDKPRRRP